jgi:tRNA-(ms[2]io[6]A)-hydroxylase
MADEKRRLNVFRPTEDDGEEVRPPWQWVGFGTAAIFGAWLPLAYAAEALKARLFAARLGDVRAPDEIAAALKALPPRDLLSLNVMVVVLMAVPLAAASFAGGFLVGRWGKGAGVREAALAGVATALIASALAWSQNGLSLAPLAGLVLAVPFAAWGGRVGGRTRARVHGPGA